MKTNKWIITITLGLGFPLALSSCRNLIESDFPSTQIEVSQVFETVSTADGALSNLYAELQYYSVISGGSLGTGALLGTYTDDLNCYIISSQNSALDLYNNRQISSNTAVLSVWTNAYKEIYSANSIINGVESSTGISEMDKKRIKGEALFIRSLIYFYLSQIFGDIPYTTTTDYTVNQSLGKISETELLIKIQNDLETAVALLEEPYRNAERVYPNRKAAELMLSLVLMQQKKWTEAEQQLKTIKQSPLYVWEPDVAKTFKKAGKHILWQLKPLKANDATEEAINYNFTTAVPNTYALSEDLVSSFASNDLRKQKWVKEITINQNHFYRCDKYRNTTANTDEYSVIFRLEGVYLLLAESLAQQNKVEEALPYINAVRQKAGIPALTSSSKEELLNNIVEENRKEFFTEHGNRFLTLKRNNRLNKLIPLKPNWQAYHQLWPLPISELLLNPNLNPQNTGY
jgi:hypothetical protein